MHPHDPWDWLSNGGQFMKQKQNASLLGTLLFWLIPGILSGIAASVSACLFAYQKLSLLADMLTKTSLPAALGQIAHGDFSAGASFLKHYGYEPFDFFLPAFCFFCILCILLFECCGILLYLRTRKQEDLLQTRIDELTVYLHAANAGEVSALSRQEDCLSYLEDEIYKTVTELSTARTSAVADHAALSDQIANMAHQLKTPLTSMSFMAELLEMHQTPDTAEYLLRLNHQIDRLRTLTSNLLTLARLDSHAITFTPKPVELTELITVSCEPLHDWMAEKEISFHTICDGEESGFFLPLDFHWTSEALLNLFKNCLEHTPPGGSITVSLASNPLYAELIIEDTGCGFAEAEIPHLFDRFFRGEHAAPESVGIGLSLAKAIIERQNGHIRAANTADGHARFTIHLYY